MTDTKPIRRIAVIGTGVMGASWTSLFPVRGLHVVESDSARATVGAGRSAPVPGEDIL